MLSIFQARFWVDVNSYLSTKQDPENYKQDPADSLHVTQHKAAISVDF